jgi:hypothetical protein
MMLARLTAAMLPMVVFSWAALAELDPITDLAGYWSGTGSVSLGSGKTERVKCSVVYRAEGGQLRQSMRCASADYSINAQAELHVTKSGQVTGSWEERTYSVKGDVSGRFAGESFNLKIQGANFTAAMSVTLSSCKQALSIMPQGLEVTKVSISLAKERCG